MAAKTFEQWWNESWEGLDGYDREGYAQAAWDAATELAEEKFNSAHSPTNTGSPKLSEKLLDFMAYLVDHCEGNVITEEYLLDVGSQFYKQLRVGA